MLRDRMTRIHIQTRQRAENWREAIRLAAMPLVEDQSVQLEYVDACIRVVEQEGPYIIFSEGVAVAHARPEDGVLHSSIALLRLGEPVTFDNGRKVRLLFVMAAESARAHLDTLIDVATLCGDTGVQQLLLDAVDAKEMYEIFRDGDI